ncbi:helicase-related protein [Novosphingobium soli]|uniref:Transcription-repair-coupling factor n=1 Tax=Novosphingobium soli TaxID=574956 RepID=A0ABV6CTA9_9SPHN
MPPSATPCDSLTTDPLRPPQGTGELVAVLLDEIGRSDLIFIARDDPDAQAVAAALQAGVPDAHVLFCLGSDALPGDDAPASPGNAGLRTSALRRLRRAQTEAGRSRIALVTTGESCARLYAPPEAFDMALPVFAAGDAVDPDSLAQTLCDVGYLSDERVDEPGEYAVRGQVVDIYPADAARPCRIELLDGRVQAIRSYDPMTQLTVAECESVEVGRASEPDSAGGVALLDHLKGARIVLADGAEKRRRTFLDLAQETASRRSGRGDAAICTQAQWQESLARHEVVVPVGSFGAPPPRFAEQRDPARAFARAAREALTHGKVLLLGTERDLRFIQPRVAKALRCEVTEAGSWQEVLAAPQGSMLRLTMPVSRGFTVGNTMAVAAADLLGSRAQREAAQGASADLDALQAGELRRGDVVVHQDHGLCVVEGLEATPDGGDALVLRFAGDARRLVPALQSDRIWRYGGEEEAVTLDKLDGSSWEKRRAEVEAALAHTAAEMTRLAAERRERQAAVLDPDSALYERFAEGFGFTETADQARAIAAVRHDLASGSPMDRLIVGDVGFGKTEVALRGAAIAALSGRQVALAAPTTVLARQHLETFARRFKGTGIAVAGLSRLSSTAERKAVKEGLAAGSIGIVVGTGAVAAKGMRYADLGLVIIDEEQRFGTADKRKLAELGADHVLTLSATPIPRTLQSALVGLQQLSVIATPPARRQPIRTTVGSFDETRVRAALLRERSRGGQSFVVVPRIEDLDGLATILSRLTPELRVLQAHGKLPAAELDETMVRFAGGDGDVLLATNIIEAGLDVPRANTMIVWRADRFGLSQLHQLRGRVGRGSRRGHILLLTQPGADIAPRTLARLQTLAAFDRLGAGFAISARDLDMRGAGDLLGEEQAGHARLIGVDLYRHLLEVAIAAARGEDVEHWTPVINAGGEGQLGADWIPDEDLRITLYARLARIGDLAGLESFEDELADRFGALPEEAARLLASVRLRVLARTAGIARVDAGPAAIALTPRPGHEDALAPLALVRSEERFLCKGDFGDAEVRMARAEELLAQIA